MIAAEAPAPRTADWRARRKQLVTASDMAAFLGKSPYKRAADVVAAKVYDLDEPPQSDAARLGELLHPGLVRFEAERRGLLPFESEVWLDRPECFMGATLDAIDAPRAGAVEGKTSGLLNPYAESDDWGDDGSDRVPVPVLLQDATQFAVCPSLEVIYNPVILGSRGYVSFEVARKSAGMGELIDWLLEEVPKRWRRFVVNREPLPDAEPASMDVLKRVRRVPASVVDLDAELVEAFTAANAAAKAAQAKAEASKERLIAALGTAEGGRCEIGTVTYMEQQRKGYAVAPSTFRVLRIKPAL